MAVALFLIGNSLGGNSDKALAAESLADVMSRMSAHGIVQIAYRETRFLELLDKPWQGSGYFYANPPDYLIKLQLQPTREVMAINGDRMLYYNAVNQARHSGVIRDDNPSGVQVETFRAIVSGDQDRLESVYDLDFNLQPKEWRLSLIPSQRSNSMGLPEFLVTGRQGGVAETIEIRQTDGDHSQIVLGKVSQGNAVTETIDRLLDEAEGD